MLTGDSLAFNSLGFAKGAGGFPNEPGKFECQGN